MASRGVQYQLDSVQYQPLTTCNTGENSTVPYVDSCNEISHHMIMPKTGLCKDHYNKMYEALHKTDKCANYGSSIKGIS